MKGFNRRKIKLKEKRIEKACECLGERRKRVDLNEKKIIL
jgi:hypothetical protein